MIGSLGLPVVALFLLGSFIVWYAWKSMLKNEISVAWNLFNTNCNSIVSEKVTAPQLFSCKSCAIFMSTFFIQHPRETTLISCWYFLRCKEQFCYCWNTFQTYVLEHLPNTYLFKVNNRNTKKVWNMFKVNQKS